VFDRRLRILVIVGALYLLAIGVRLFDMQALNFGQWRLEAASLARRSIRLSARRGRILDRNGVPLAEDRIQNNLYLRLDREDDGSFVCTGCGKPVHTEHEKPPRRCRTCGSSEFDPGEQADWSKLPELLGLDPAKFRACGARAKKRYELAVKAEIKRRKKSWKRVKPADVRRVLLPREYLFFEDAPRAVVKEVVLHPGRYWGVVVRPVIRRFRTEAPSIRRTVGAIGKLNQEEVRRVHEEEGLSYSEIYRIRVGRTGLEEWFEERLQSREGLKVVERDRRGEVREVLSERPARDGRDVRITLELKLQDRMHRVLQAVCAQHQADAGAFVAIDPATGEVLAMVSYAGEGEVFDPAITAIVPGSVFKVVTALAGIESGRIDPAASFSCPGIGCHVHDDVNLLGAICQSCNRYFADAAVKIGVDLWPEWGRKLGFGSPTGIELRQEMGGVVPDQEWKFRAYERNPTYWGTADFGAPDLRQAGFGRGALLVTPVQVARFMAILANGGRFVTPSLVVGESEVGGVVVHARALALVREGLKAVVTRGTARRTELRRHRVAGKTGTAEVSSDLDLNVSWFAGYAPAERPRVAFACMIRNTPSTGAAAASPVILAYLDEVLGK